MRRVDKMISHDEIPKEGSDMASKKVLYDWVESIRVSAENAKKCIKGSKSMFVSEDSSLDKATDYIGEIIGKCKAIKIVLDNSN